MNVQNREEENNKLHLVIGDPIPEDGPTEFSDIILYIRDDEANLHFYSEIRLPYLINYTEFYDCFEDPRYYFYEGYDEKRRSFRYCCELKPFGEMRGLYRLLNGRPIKICPIKTVKSMNHEDIKGRT